MVSFLTRLKICDELYESLIDSNAIAICTEWDEFKNINWNEVKTKMDKDFLVFDGRNVINKENLNSLGFKSYVIGQS